MSLYLLAEVSKRVENNEKKIFCSGWWNKKTEHFIIKSQCSQNKYLCYNKTSLKFKHLAWNNKPVCLSCILIGNKIIAINYFLDKIFTYYHNYYLKDNQFMKVLMQKITDSCLNKINIPLLYTKITNIYRDYYKDVTPIIHSIRLFENDYNQVNNKNYISMKKLLELSE